MMTPKFLLDNISTIRVNDDTQFKIQRPYYTFIKHRVIEDILNECPSGEINRGIVTEFFKRGEHVHGFFAAMIWGGISTGGPTGDNLSLLLTVEPEKLQQHIVTVSHYVEQNKFSDAYHYMNGAGKLRGLGDSFFTKLFFFLGKANEQDIIPPIFDKWTKLAYAALLVDSEDYDQFHRYISSVKGVDVRFRSAYQGEAYSDFVVKMNRWAKGCEVGVSDLEQFIFGCNKKKDPSASNPRMIFEKKVNEFMGTAVS
jgi:hypothetical protein